MRNQLYLLLEMGASFDTGKAALERIIQMSEEELAVNLPLAVGDLASSL
jgi:hypothetical protein